VSEQHGTPASVAGPADLWTEDGIEFVIAAHARNIRPGRPRSKCCERRLRHVIARSNKHANPHIALSLRGLV
jgi:hypothetical protein